MSNFDNQNIYRVIGLMSGTSLDGLDIAFCEFITNEQADFAIQFKIIEAETIDYSAFLKETLSTIEHYPAVLFSEWDRKLGAFFGEEVRKFIVSKNRHIGTKK